MSALAPAPPLPTPVQDQILQTSIRLAALRYSDPSACAQAISAPLNALPRTSSPSLTRAALAEMPWIDMNLASRIADTDLLAFMLAWSRAGGGYRRPLHFALDDDEAAMCLAAHGGHVHVLEWWLAEYPEIARVSDRVCEAASRGGQVRVLEWVGLNHVPVDKGGCSGNCVPQPDDQELRLEILEWWHNRYPRSDHVKLHLYAATNAGHLAILRWRHSVSESSLAWLDMHAAVNAALANGHVHVLDWLADEHAVDFKALVFPAPRRRRNANITLVGLVDMMRRHQCGSMDWWSSRKLPVGVNVAEMLTAACKSGIVAGVQWLMDHYPDECKGVADTVVQTAFAKEGCAPGDLELAKVLVASPAFADKLTPAAFTEIAKGSQGQGSRREFLMQIDPFLAATDGGHVHVLDWLSSAAGLAPFIDWPEYSQQYLVCAGCKTRGTQLLDWWAARVPALGPFEPRRALVHASVHGDVDQLNWWYDHKYLPRGVELGCLPKYIEAAARKDHVCVLEWFAEHFGDQMRDFPQAIWVDGAAAAGHVQVLRWWIDVFGGLEHVGEVHLLDSATKNGQVAVLEWCRNELAPQLRDMSQLPAVSFEAIDQASGTGKLNVLDWWVCASPAWPFAYSGRALEPVYKEGYMSPAWWMRHGFSFAGHRVAYQVGRNTLALDAMIRLGAEVRVHSMQGGERSLGSWKLDLVAEVARRGCFADLMYLQGKPGFWPTDSKQIDLLLQSVERSGQASAVRTWLEEQFGRDRVGPPAG